MLKTDSLKAVELIYQSLDSKKAIDIKILDIEKITPVADYFVIASGSSDSQIEAMMDAVDEAMTKAGYQMKHQEGFKRGGWVLLDYGSVVVHIFDTENRQFYDLERIWKDAGTVDPSELNITQK